MSPVGHCMLDQVRTMSCSRTQHVVGGKGGALVYVRTNIDYEQTVSIGGLREAFPLLSWVQLTGQAAGHALE